MALDLSPPGDNEDKTPLCLLRYRLEGFLRKEPHYASIKCMRSRDRNVEHV
jgi:hypothetical protein